MVGEGIRQIGDGLLEVAEEGLQALLVSDININEVYDVEQTPFARGKYAAVRRAVHKKTGVQYAAKFLRRRRRAQCTLREIGHEIAVLMLCADSKHIVKLNAVHETKTETALILELATGGELQAILDEDGSLTEVQAQMCMREILNALQYLHSKRIAHLDLKPQNILLCGDRVDDGLKLCDFGISRLVAEVGEVREILGTPDYVAPEVLQYEPLSLATDIWSIGVLAYVLLTGCSPFGGDTKQETFLNISQCNLHFPEDLFENISEEAMDFIRSALRIKPKERMTATECLNHQWLNSTPETSADVSANNSTSIGLRLGLDVQTPTILLKTANSQNSQNPLTSSSTPTNTTLFDNHICDTTPNSIPTITTTKPESVSCNFTTSVVTMLSSSSFSNQSAALSIKEEVTTNPVYFKNTTNHCNNKENLSCNVKFFGLNYQTPDISTKSMPTHLHSALPKVHTPPTTPHIFPDAPTTPKVSRKSSPDSPPSVKALVKKFQLASPEYNNASDSPVSTPTSRRTEFKVEFASTTSLIDSSRADASDLSTKNQSPNTSATVSATPSSAMPAGIRKSLIIEHGILC